MIDAEIDLDAFKIIHIRVSQRPWLDESPMRALVQILKAEPLHPACDMRDTSEWGSGEVQMPFRGLCWGDCKYVPIAGTGQRQLIGTKPIHPDHPEAVRYCGNFFETSLAFELDTDDPALIAFLDALIAENMATPAYVDALDKVRRYKR